MSILVRFAPASMNAEQYDEVSARVKAETHWPPDGLLVHCCFGSGNALRVSEIWESREKMEAFGSQLMPILSQAGIDVESTPPEFRDVHNVEFGAR